MLAHDGCLRAANDARAGHRGTGFQARPSLSRPCTAHGGARRTGSRAPIRTLADWNVRRDHTLAHFQEVAGTLPGGERRVPLDIQVVSTTKEAAFIRNKISFATEPGDRVPAWLLIPDEVRKPAGKHPAVLCLHQTIAIGKDEPAGLGQNRELAYARELAERGYVTLAPDYPNFGEYKIDVYNLGYASATMKAIWNNLRAVDLLCDLDQVDSSRIGVIGHSLGGHNAIFTALYDARIKAVVSSCGFNAFPSYFKGDITGWSHQGYMPRLQARYGLDLKKVPFDFPELIAALAPRSFSQARLCTTPISRSKVCGRASMPRGRSMKCSMPPIVWWRSIPTLNIPSQERPARALSLPGSPPGTTLLRRCSRPKCLTKKEMIVVYDTLRQSRMDCGRTTRRDIERHG